MRVLLIGLSLLNGIAQAQPERAVAERGEAEGRANAEAVTHTVPFGAEGNVLEMVVSNVRETSLGVIRVRVKEAPEWVRVDPAEVVLEDLKAASEMIAVFNFDMLRSAPVGETGTLQFEVHTGTGQAFTKTVLLQAGAPTSFRVYANWPNPFRHQTTLAYELPEPAQVRLLIYDLLGRRVASLVDGHKEVGRHEVIWHARSIASGVYLYRLLVEGAGGTQHIEQGRMLRIQ